MIIALAWPDRTSFIRQEQWAKYLKFLFPQTHPKRTHYI